jgi:hypothetical protein
MIAIIGTPDSTTTYMANALARSETSYIIVCNSSDYTYEPPKPPDLSALVHAFKLHQVMTEAEVALMRMWNDQPTREGIQTCRERHRNLYSSIKSLPHFRSRSDRRIPCWRSTRWKSLT